MSDYERGYKQGLEDGHRCEKRHATIDSLEKQVAMSVEVANAAIAKAKRETWEEAAQAREIVTKWRLGELLNDPDLANAIAAAIAQAKREVWEEAADIASNHACGGDDDIICQHINCATIIEGHCRAQAVKVGT